MTSRFSPTLAVLMVGLGSACMLTGCGGQDTSQEGGQAGGQQPVILTAAAQLNQQDIDAFTSAVKLSSCSFVITPGVATFTPSSELSRLLFGDANGSAHKQSFAVPPIGSGGASITITSMKAEMAGTGLTLADTTAVAKISFDGMLHARIPAPLVGSVSADIQVNSSSISVAVTYDPATARIRVSGVSSQLSTRTKNCGLLGWCNGIVDNILRARLPTLVEAMLRQTATTGLDSADATARLDELLVGGYNLKDPQPTPWSMVDSTLTLSGSAFFFTAQRPGP